MNFVNTMGLVIAIAVLIVSIFKHVHPVYSTLIAAAIAGLTNGIPFWDIYVKYFAPGMTASFASFMFIFFFSTLYGKLMGDSGSASTIAYKLIDWFGKDKAILTIGLSTAVLTYGGVSAFVVIFIMIPIGVVILRETNVPKTLLPAIIGWGQATFAMTALPGTPQLTNLIPSQILGTSTYAAPVLGIVASLIMGVGGYLYLNEQIKKVKKKNIGFDESTVKDIKMNLKEIKREDCPSLICALLPMLSLMLLYLAFSNGWLGFKMDTFNAINTSTIISIIEIFILNISKVKSLLTSLKESSTQWISPLINLTVIIGFASVVKATSGFQSFINFAMNISASPYISAIIFINIVSAITGSTSSSLTISMNSMADKWLAAGANPEVLHRLATVSSGILDSVPQSPGMYTSIDICGETYESSYMHMIWITFIMPLIATIVILGLAQLGVV